jgi:hypothetical protein
MIAITNAITIAIAIITIAIIANSPRPNAHSYAHN